MVRAQVDLEAVARTWRERGFSCGLWVDRPGQVWADYVHDVDELVMVIKDDVEFEQDRCAAPRGLAVCGQVADVARKRLRSQREHVPKSA